MIRFLGVAIAWLSMSVGAATACASDDWARFLSPGAQTEMLLNILKTPSGREVLLLDMTTLEGERYVGEFAKRWMFITFNSGPERCIDQAVVLGSYAYAQDGAGSARNFALHYYGGDRHATLELYTREPELEDITERALAALN